MLTSTTAWCLLRLPLLGLILKTEKKLSKNITKKDKKKNLPKSCQKLPQNLKN